MLMTDTPDTPAPQAPPFPDPAALRRSYSRREAWVRALGVLLGTCGALLGVYAVLVIWASLVAGVGAGAIGALLLYFGRSLYRLGDGGKRFAIALCGVVILWRCNALIDIAENHGSFDGSLLSIVLPIVLPIVVATVVIISLVGERADVVFSDEYRKLVSSVARDSAPTAATSGRFLGAIGSRATRRKPP